MRTTWPAVTGWAWLRTASLRNTFRTGAATASALLGPGDREDPHRKAGDHFLANVTGELRLRDQDAGDRIHLGGDLLHHRSDGPRRRLHLDPQGRPWRQPGTVPWRQCEAYDGPFAAQQ